MKPTRFALLAAAGGLAAATILVPVTAGTALAYSATGTIKAPAPIGNHSTDLEFSLRTCPNMPLTQGVNGWVFALPAPASAGDTVSVHGADSTGLYDLAAYVYKSNCDYDRVETAGKNLSLTLAANDQFISVFTTNGADVTVTLNSPAITLGGGGTGPNDPLFAQDGEGDMFFAGQWGLRKIQAPQAWAQYINGSTTTKATGSGIKVAVLDTGLDLDHPDFQCSGKVNVRPNADLDPDSSSSPDDDNGHGTHTAGIIGACTNNNVGVAGVAPGSQLLPYQVLSATATDITLADSIKDATDEGAHVINMSLSFGIAPGGLVSVPGSGSALGWLGGLPEVRDAIDYAVAAGVVVVASAGNDSFPICSYPALEWNVVCVGSSDPRDVNSWYGSFPVKDDDSDLTGPGLLAPGGTGTLLCDWSSEEIISTYDEDVDAAEGNCDGLSGYASIQGTSMAAPHVAGVAALVYQDIGSSRSLANANKVVEALTRSAVDLYTPGYDPQSGYGRVDALRAVNYWS